MSRPLSTEEVRKNYRIFLSGSLLALDDARFLIATCQPLNFIAHIIVNGMVEAFASCSASATTRYTMKIERVTNRIIKEVLDDFESTIHQKLNRLQSRLPRETKTIPPCMWRRSADHKTRGYKDVLRQSVDALIDLGDTLGDPDTDQDYKRSRDPLRNGMAVLPDKVAAIQDIYDDLLTDGALGSCDHAIALIKTLQKTLNRDAARHHFDVWNAAILSGETDRPYTSHSLGRRPTQTENNPATVIGTEAPQNA